jgi:hypothetical protein
MEKENREYKDSVFTDLFSKDMGAKDNILELYNALFDTDYTDPSVVDVVALENVLFCNLKDDVAFTVKNRRIILSEHQSTINENMPLRSLMYIAREYEKIVPVRDRYKRSLVRIPTPMFLVFYNGKEDAPVEQILRLSDAFREEDGNKDLELIVRVINITPDKHHPLLEKCKVLREYSQFIETVREYKNDEHKLRKAVEECIHKGILKEYLQRKSYEVLNMLMAEYDYATDIEVQREEAAEEAAKEATKKATNKTFVEAVENAAQNFNVSIEEACEKLGKSYEVYLQAKKSI